MQTALQNPHYKKIWKEINWDLRNPQAETLEEALLEEACYDDCLFIEKNYIGTPKVFYNDCGYAYAFNFCSDYNYKNNRKISFYDGVQRKQYDVNTGILLEEYTEEILNKERLLQHIVGRPITLFDILKLLNAKPQEDCSSYIADGVGIFKYFIDWRPAELVCNFETNSLCETAPETWEKIAELI